MSAIVISADHSRLVNSNLRFSTMYDATLYARNSKINRKLWSSCRAEAVSSTSIHMTHLPRMYPTDATAIGMNTIAKALEYSLFGVRSPNPMVFEKKPRNH